MRQFIFSRTDNVKEKISLVIWCTLHNYIIGLCLAETRANNLTFGWPLNKHLYYVFFCSIINGQEWIWQNCRPLCLTVFMRSQCFISAGVLLMCYVPYSHIHTDLGLLAPWNKAWTEKKQQHHLLLTVLNQVQTVDFLHAYKSFIHVLQPTENYYFLVFSHLQFTLILATLSISWKSFFLILHLHFCCFK